MDLYTYRREAQYTPGTDLRGFDVEAPDGHIGKIDEESHEASSSCLVVDTGFWILDKKRLVPAAAVQSVDYEEKKVHVALTKDQIRDAPDYDSERHTADEADYHREVAAYYSAIVSDVRETY